MVVAERQGHDIEALAALPNDERIQMIRADRWIGYPRAREALQKLEELYNWPPKQRMPNCLLIGPTNNGKSMIIEKFKRSHPPSISLDGHHEIIPVVAVQMPCEPTVSRFYSMLLSSMGAPSPGKGLKPLGFENLVLTLLRQTKVRVLIIDELHNMMTGASDTRREFLNLLRFLGNELRIPIVGVGTKNAYLAIRTDDQLENRFEPIVLPPWAEGSELNSLLASFAVSLPLRKRSSISGPDTARYILSRTDGIIGEISRFLCSAAIAAIESGEEAITPHSLSMASYLPPAERRQTFERMIR